jgi:hypothetical protein
MKKISRLLLGFSIVLVIITGGCKEKERIFPLKPGPYSTLNIK